MLGSAVFDSNFLHSYVLWTIESHSIPIPTALSALTLALPTITGLAVEIISKPTKHSTNGISSSISRPTSTRVRPPTLGVLLIFQTVLATLAGTYLAPADSLTCGLQTQWLALFRAKDVRRIRAIQDALECCGFRSPQDMAFPFPPAPSSCPDTFGRDRSCLSPWRAEERTMAALLLGVVVLVVLWQTLVLVGPQSPASWFGSHPRDDEQRIRGAILYNEDAEAGHDDDDRSAVGRYEDEPGESADRGRAAIRQSEDFSRVQSSELPDSQEHWRSRG
jgi:hypothetical protein